jgi:quercetin dioxygenase-like cupin family protein
MNDERVDPNKKWPAHLDAVTAAAGHHRVLLENDRVRVLDALVKPGETVPLHTHKWPSAVYIISSDDFIRLDANGSVVADSRKMDINSEPGTVIWLPPLETHSVRNVGEKETRAIVFELKS